MASELVLSLSKLPITVDFTVCIKIGGAAPWIKPDQFGKLGTDGYQIGPTHLLVTIASDIAPI